MADNVFCLLVDDTIEDIDCVENSDAVDGIIVESSVPMKYKKKADRKEICKKCKYNDW